MNAGWRFEEFRSVTGWDLRTEWSGEMEKLEKQGWGRRDTESFQLTAGGLRFADSAAEMFLR
jgi:coproporphyrinogen III oxidase-like Fe-S oxidoreductase